MQIFVRKPEGKTITLNVESNEKICSIKRRLEDKEGICSDLHVGLMYCGKVLEDNRTLADYFILKDSTLYSTLSPKPLLHIYVKILDGKSTTLTSIMNLNTTMNCERQQSVASQPPTKLHKHTASQVAPNQTKIAPSAKQTTPTKAAQNRHSIIETNNEEMCAEYIQRLATCADRQAMSCNNYDANLKLFALHQAKVHATSFLRILCYFIVLH